MPATQSNVIVQITTTRPDGAVVTGQLANAVSGASSSIYQSGSSGTLALKALGAATLAVLGGAFVFAA